MVNTNDGTSCWRPRFSFKDCPGQVEMPMPTAGERSRVVTNAATDPRVIPSFNDGEFDIGMTWRCVLITTQILSSLVIIIMSPVSTAAAYRWKLTQFSSTHSRCRRFEKGSNIFKKDLPSRARDDVRSQPNQQNETVLEQRPMVPYGP